MDRAVSQERQGCLSDQVPSGTVGVYRWIVQLLKHKPEGRRKNHRTMSRTTEIISSSYKPMLLFTLHSLFIALIFTLERKKNHYMKLSISLYLALRLLHRAGWYSTFCASPQVCSITCHDPGWAGGGDQVTPTKLWQFTPLQSWSLTADVLNAWLERKIIINFSSVPVETADSLDC